MKLQYLGDSKDSFKWHYHDYLTNRIGYPVLNILLMMTPDDHSNDGKTLPDLFPADREILSFCTKLRTHRDLSLIPDLPTETGSNYRVILHKPDCLLTKQNRKAYFTGLTNNEDQVVLLDPDNGFEPGKKFNEKHVTYSEITTILDQLSSRSVVSVFQHFRRVKFIDDYARIRERLSSLDTSIYTTALYWHQLMFVLVSRSEKAINKVRRINEDYALTCNCVTIL